MLAAVMSAEAAPSVDPHALAVGGCSHGDRWRGGAGGIGGAGEQQTQQ